MSALDRKIEDAGTFYVSQVDPLKQRKGVEQCCDPYCVALAALVCLTSPASAEAAAYCDGMDPAEWFQVEADRIVADLERFLEEEQLCADRAALGAWRLSFLR